MLRVRVEILGGPSSRPYVMTSSGSVQTGIFCVLEQIKTVFILGLEGGHYRTLHARLHIKGYRIPITRAPPMSVSRSRKNSTQDHFKVSDLRRHMGASRNKGTS